MIVRIALGWALLVALFGGFAVVGARFIGWRGMGTVLGLTAAIVLVVLAASWLIAGSLS